VIAAALVLTSVAYAVGVKAASSTPTTPVVFVSTGEEFPDGFGAGPAAALNRGPVLLVRQNSIPAATAAELTRLKPDRIIVVGGPVAISNSVETQLGAFAADVDRIGGSDRYGTAAEISKEFFPASLNGLGIEMYVVKNKVTFAAGQKGFVKVQCEAGDQATGGGFTKASSVVIDQNRAQLSLHDLPIGWEIFAVSNSASEHPIGVEVICMDMTP
jgi:hypothetical protein